MKNAYQKKGTHPIYHPLSHLQYMHMYHWRWNRGGG